MIEYPFSNPLGRDTVFELRISHPHELVPVGRPEDYRALKAAAAARGSDGGSSTGGWRMRMGVSGDVLFSTPVLLR